MFSSDESFTKKHQELSRLISEVKFIELIDYIKTDNDVPDIEGDFKLRLDAILRKCKSCGDLHLNILASKGISDDWKEIKELLEIEWRRKKKL